MAAAPKKKKILVGKAPITVVRTATSMVQVYAGAPVPEGITDEDADRLLKEEYLEEREVEVDAGSDAS